MFDCILSYLNLFIYYKNKKKRLWSAVGFSKGFTDVYVTCPLGIEQSLTHNVNFSFIFISIHIIIFTLSTSAKNNNILMEEKKEKKIEWKRLKEKNWDCYHVLMLVGNCVTKQVWYAPKGMLSKQVYCEFQLDCYYCFLWESRFLMWRIKQTNKQTNKQ